jgi:hypothetical protein
MKSIPCSILMPVILFGLCGCAVRPWQKETLSKPYMKFSQDSAVQHFYQHSLITVEQAEGGEGGAGGGCGCR